MEIIVTGPPPGAPSPLPEHVELLNEVIAILGSADLLTKEAIPVVKEALAPLDDLITRLDHFDGHAYPGGFQRGLQEARFNLVAGELSTTLTMLRNSSAVPVATSAPSTGTVPAA